MPSDAPAILSIRMRFDDEARIGPGKIALLEGIARTGSIAAAGREMGMSYRRAWLLVDAVNAMFDEPVVVTAAGGAHGGGSTLTPLGAALVDAYRQVERDTTRSMDRHLGPLLSRRRRVDQS
jgi:molybdate transport system regulatory protein